MLFTPLLSSTAVGTLEFRSITEPIKSSFRDVNYVQAECTNIDPASRLALPFNATASHIWAQYRWIIEPGKY